MSIIISPGSRLHDAAPDEQVHEDYAFLPYGACFALSDDGEPLIERVQRLIAESNRRSEAELAQEWAHHGTEHAASPPVATESSPVASESNAPQSGAASSTDFLRELKQQIGPAHLQEADKPDEDAWRADPLR